VLELRSRVVQAMHEWWVCVAGDIALLITPAGGKGMNPGDPGRA
jgi:2-polyprenyl-6-methoxyphenol hydroxylase-like FAD-dependent oxidoreductase